MTAPIPNPQPDPQPATRSRRARRFPDDRSSTEALYAAQRLAFGPMMFQAVRVLRESGALAFVHSKGAAGATPEELAERTDLSLYGARVLLEAGLAAEALSMVDDRFVETKVGYFLLHDAMTGINMDFVHHVCYRSMFHLEASLQEGRPAGLAEHGSWPTIYPALSKLAPSTRESWFAFDHFYSDGTFPVAAPMVLARRPRQILDIGGNTGKFARLCCEIDPEVRVSIVDLPGQLAVALEQSETAGIADRVTGVGMDLLDSAAQLPHGFDAIWMSQFLDCFSETEATSILARAAEAMNPEARLYILETLWDRQRHDAARFCLLNTSLYFSAVANGNSKMFHSERLIACVRAAGLEVEDETDGLGFHTLLRCRRA